MGAAVNALPGGEIVPAMDRGLLDAAEFNNATSDRLLGFADVSKVCMLQSYHQNAEQFEIMFNKTKFDALPAKMKAIIENAVEAASQDMSWKAIDRYSKDYIELQTKDKVKFYKTPDSVLQKQLEVYDAAAAKRKDNAMFNEIADSQKAFAERAVRSGTSTPTSAGAWRTTTTSASPRASPRRKRPDTSLTPRHHPATPDGVFFGAYNFIACKNCCFSSTRSAPGSGRRFPSSSSRSRCTFHWEVFSRYVLDNPRAWAFDVMIMMYGTLFMMAGAYTLAKNGHVRGDVLYGFFHAAHAGDAST